MASLTDLTSTTGVEKYLADTPFAAHTIQHLSGGTANYVFRLTLISPYDGHATVILKHAKPYIASAVGIPFSLERQKYEVEALRAVQDSLAADAIVTVPSVLLFDEGESLIIMEDCGSNAVTLKDLMLNNPPSSQTSQQIGRELATFISHVHSIGTRTPALAHRFEQNQLGKQMTIFATYGRVLSTIRGENALPYLPNLQLNVSANNLETIAQVVQDATDTILKKSTCMTMGDFWSGNVMVNIDNDKLINLYVLDCELAKTGLAAADLGQFVSELHLLRQFSSLPAASEMIQAFLSTYQASYQRDDLLTLARRTLAHIGAHLVVFTPRVDWGSEEITKSVMEEGVQCLLNATAAMENALDKTLVSTLLG